VSGCDGLGSAVRRDKALGAAAAMVSLNAYEPFE
jgi:hypothetical protein